MTSGGRWRKLHHHGLTPLNHPLFGITHNPPPIDGSCDPDAMSGFALASARPSAASAEVRSYGGSAAGWSARAILVLVGPNGSL
jgi:hypothetical protein